MMVSIYGDRVQQARTLRAMPSGVLAESLGWRADKQSKMERSHVTQVRPDEFEALIRVLRFPADFFTTAPVDPVHDSDLLFRAPKSTPKRERRYLAEFVRSSWEVLTFLDERAQLPPVRLPRRKNRDLTDIALATRIELGHQQDEPIPHLLHQVERAGVPVITRQHGLTPAEAGTIDVERGSTLLTEKHLGYSTWVGEFRERPIIVVRALDSWERTRWTIAHEVGHLVLHRAAVPDNAEEEASKFASELLAPHQEVAKELPRHVTLASLVDVKLRWGISIGALIMHLHHYGLIADERFETLRAQIYTRKNPQTGRTWGMDEPGFDARQPERPRLLAAWIERGLGVSSSAAAAALPGMIYPADMLGEMLSGQRQAPNRANDSRKQTNTSGQTPKPRQEPELASVLRLIDR